MKNKELKPGMPLFDLIEESLENYNQSQFIFSFDKACNSFELALWQNNKLDVKNIGVYENGISLAQSFLSLITDKKKITEDEGSFGVHCDFDFKGKVIYVKAVFFEANIAKTNMRLFVNISYVKRDYDVVGATSINDLQYVTPMN